MTRRQTDGRFDPVTSILIIAAGGFVAWLVWWLVAYGAYIVITKADGFFRLAADVLGDLP